MTLPNEAPLQKLQFYVTTAYKCGYLANQMAQSLIASPQNLVDTDVYSGLIQQGFRRSGKFAYRPHCERCNACTPVRIMLSQFVPTRSQKRAFKQHAALTTRILPVAFHAHHYALYSAYQTARHQEADTQTNNDNVDNNNSPEQYQQFLCQSNVESVMIEFSDAEQRVVMVSVVDVVHDGLSAVYTFYDASQAKASYGTYSIIWLCEWAKQFGLPYVYLGYWIANSQKMAYKQLYQPQEKLIDGEWVRNT